MNIYNKIKWVLSILLVFVIVLTTNLIDKDNFNRLRHSIVTIYEDRLIANDLIYELTLLIQEKHIALLTSDSIFYKQERLETNDKIQAIIRRYEQTKITEEEREIFNRFKNNIDRLTALEKAFIASGKPHQENLLHQINALKENLYNLTKIQLKEGKRQMVFSQRTMDTIELFTQIEIIFLVVMAVLIQIIILYKPPKH
ncbi:mRNA degradation ribonuclease J1/J2 [Catalinimonas alkaloidigena]|uniref:MCP four helix bundle domain-containing protein n=1 Tax=Catalinimonas alkaloidigena TaxID=1075417 RepID=UPI002406ECB2|nr:MCP four helix bundle domain-containing protein [Catalinimonas alkaloidigena]MDF9797312.1 mRNA degradation ribonuclease J1/J2 [Catalinimonas alkaloidigena]